MHCLAALRQAKLICFAPAPGHVPASDVRYYFSSGTKADIPILRICAKSAARRHLSATPVISARFYAAPQLASASAFLTICGGMSSAEVLSAEIDAIVVSTWQCNPGLE
jgi:hypothetical protein